MQEYLICNVGRRKASSKCKKFVMLEVNFVGTKTWQNRIRLRKTKKGGFHRLQASLFLVNFFGLGKAELLHSADSHAISVASHKQTKVLISSSILLIKTQFLWWHL